MFLTIPAGCACIVERNGVKLGEWAPGRHKADWRHRVAFVVTQHTCTYNYTVHDCATRDNVLARVDLTLVFNIDNATTFVYKIGATHFSLCSHVHVRIPSSFFTWFVLDRRDAQGSGRGSDSRSGAFDRPHQHLRAACVCSRPDHCCSQPHCLFLPFFSSVFLFCDCSFL